MEYQANDPYDSKMRVVSISNLEAMCEEVSGCMCRKFGIGDVRDHSVEVYFTNEDDCAFNHTISAVFPLFEDERGNCYVILSALAMRTDFEKESEEDSRIEESDYGAFQELLEAPKMEREIYTENYSIAA